MLQHTSALHDAAAPAVSNQTSHMVWRQRRMKLWLPHRATCAEVSLANPPCRNDADGCTVDQVEANDARFFKQLEKEVQSVNRCGWSTEFHESAGRGGQCCNAMHNAAEYT